MSEFSNGTTPTEVDSSIPEIWAKDALRRVKVEGFWGPFVGPEGSGAPIIQKTELLNGEGDLIHIQVTDPLTGAGQTGDTSVVVGNEEHLATGEIKASPLLYRHGVRINSRAGKKSILDLRAEGRMRLEEWMRNKIDNKRFETLLATSLPAPLASETYTPNAYAVGGGTTADSVAVGDLLTVGEVQKIKLALRLQQAKPVMVGGKPHYFLVVHPNSTYGLKQDTRYEAWVREAAARGDSNPLFTGALAVIDGMVIYDHENVPVADNATSVAVGKGIAFGSEFAIEALDENVRFDEDTFDYGHEYGIAVRTAFQTRRALELSSIQVYTQAEDVT